MGRVSVSVLLSRNSSTPDGLRVRREDNTTNEQLCGEEENPLRCLASKHQSAPFKRPTNIPFTLFVRQGRAALAYTRHLHHALLGNSAS